MTVTEGAFFIVSFFASIVGAICGIGGGVIIKPVLDLFHMVGVSAISFLSGCTVLSMSCYSVGRGLLAHESKVDIKTGTLLALGAAMGGIVGKALFDGIKSLFANTETIGAVQAVCLALITIGTLLYTWNKSKIKTKQITSKSGCVAIGLLLGIMSSFLGIGGGPINLVVLYYFFSMETKTAAQNSLYIILFSQIASLFSAIAANTVPSFPVSLLIVMVTGGILGGMAGRKINKRMDNKAVEKLFIILMAVIIGISVYNALQYSGMV